MQKYNKELTPVIYGPSSIKVLHYDIAPNKGVLGLIGTTV